MTFEAFAAAPRPQIQPHKCACMGCIDRVLPRNLMRFHPNEELYSGRIRAISPIGRAWLNGSTLRVRFIGGTEAQRAKVKLQASWWSDVANIKFDYSQSPQAEIRIAFNPADGAWSYIGTDCRSIPSDQPTMNLAFDDGGTYAHEIGHCLAMLHEHQSPEGGLQWNEAQVIKDLEGPPNFWSVETIRHNIFDKYNVSQINSSAFDPASIMLYSFPASWTLNGFSSKPNNVLSAMDKAFVGSAKMYPKDKPTPSTAIELQVDAPLRTKGEIGVFGEVDVYAFTVITPGRFLLDVTGWSDTVMRLWGPNSETALISENDDGGYYLSPRINIDLIAGRYFVDIRHYNKLKGLGAYSVRVSTV